jgi:hypothetical protein
MSFEMLKKERKMKQHRRFRTIRATVVLMVIAGVAILIAPSASASAPTATATLTGSVTTAGQDGNFTFSVTPTSRTLAAFTVTAPAGWLISSSTAGTVSTDKRTISVSGLSVNSSQSASVNFTATACVANSYSFGYTATDSQGRSYGTPSSISASVAAPSCSLAFVNQPQDAKENQKINATPFQGGTQDLQVKLLDGASQALGFAAYPVQVTFGLAAGVDAITGQTLVSGTLTVDPENTNASGIATFVDRLSIAEKNEPELSSYALLPETTGTAPTITGDPSHGFDIWETQCPGGGCTVNLRGGNDLYTSPSGATSGDLSASQLPGALPNLVCADQTTVIFSDTIFSSQFTGNGATKLVSHVTRKDMKAAANNGQAHVAWCIGLPDPWSAKGGPAVRENTDGLGGDDLYVGLVPACPNTNPQLAAPCISRQFGDGSGGNFTEGYLPPGDPPRRT